MHRLTSFMLRLLRIQKTSLHLLYCQGTGSPPRRPGTEGAVGHAFPSPKSCFQKQYFEVLDLLTNELKCRFQQKRGLPMAAMI